MVPSISNLPHPLLINGLNHILPPPSEEFEKEFAGILPEGKSIPSSWGVTRYYEFKPSSTPQSKVLLIHGGGTSAIGMAPLALKLSAAGNTVIAYDLWGHGGSSTPLTPHIPAILHFQILELLSHLRWASAHFIGFSMGGSITATFVSLYPHLVTSATIVAGAGLWRKSGRSWIEVFKQDGGWGREWIGRKTIIDFVEGHAPPREGWRERLREGKVDTEAVQKWQRDHHAGHEASIVSYWRYSGVFDQHESYRKLVGGSVEVLIILGEKDTVIEPVETRRELEGLGWKEEVVVVEGATHEIARSHVKEIADLTEKFWSCLKK